LLSLPAYCMRLRCLQGHCFIKAPHFSFKITEPCILLSNSFLLLHYCNSKILVFFTIFSVADITGTGMSS
jgi:hypothetical protein